jgi:hypothetical protein
MEREILPGVEEDGSDTTNGTLIARFMANLRNRQEAVWAAVSHGRVVIDTEDRQLDVQHCETLVTRCVVYLPKNLKAFWESTDGACYATLADAARGAWGVSENWPWDSLKVEWLLDIPPELADFVAKNIDRPKPRRYNSTAVTYLERDGVAWLTPPEAKLYDAIKEAGWLFIPQPQFLAGEEIDRRPDFLIYWHNRSNFAVLIEIDSDAHHLPSQRDADEAKERLFQSRGFQYLRFSVKKVNSDVIGVIREIADFCNRRFGG